MVPPLESELAELRAQVARLRAENERLLRLLGLSPTEARPPGPIQTGMFDAASGMVHGLARQIGTGLLREPIALRGRMNLSSYDRLFPSQDVLQVGAPGDLIAAPLQGLNRRRGTTVFLDLATLEPHEEASCGPRVGEVEAMWVARPSHVAVRGRASCSRF